MIAGKNNESSPEADTESRSSDQNEISNGLTSEESIEEGKQRETEDEDQEDDYIGDESTEEENTEDVELVENEMPLLKYARLVGSLPRAFSSTTEQDESKDIEADDKAEAVFTTRCTASTFGKHRRHHLLAVGFSNGDLHLVDPVTGLDLISPSFLQVCPQGGHTSKVPGINSVTGISLDAEGRSLAACQRNGNICLWELKYGRDPLATRREGSPASATAGGSSVGVISGSRSVASERHSQSVRSLPALGATTPPRSSVPGTIGGASPGRSNLTSEQVQSQEILSRFGPKIFSPPSALFRFSYGLSSIPTCLALDPARSRKSESRFVVGFADGRIVLTKKGGFWNRRTDAVIYQSSSVARKDDESRANATRRAVSGAGGIDAIIWRGNLIAWADVT